MKIVLGMKKNKNGMLLSCVGELLSSIIVHTLKFYKSLNEEKKESYVKTTQEVETEVYPQWQIKNNKPQYSQLQFTVAPAKIKRPGKRTVRKVSHLTNPYPLDFSLSLALVQTKRSTDFL